jgi:3-oxoacyl-[acyl-carrier-protein] synthase II
MRRIVITGLGAITPIGKDVASFWYSLAAGVSGASPLSQDKFAGCPVRVACEVKAFDPLYYMTSPWAEQTSRATQFGLAAARQALADSRLDIGKAVDSERVGIVLNTGSGDWAEIEMESQMLRQNGAHAVSPFFIARVMPNALSGSVAIALGAKGPVLTSTQAGASGSYALVQAAHFLKRGEADVMLAGGSESSISAVMLAELSRFGALTDWPDRPSNASRPFDAGRRGFVLGEGAAVMVLETEAHARQRGAPIYAEVLEGSLVTGAFNGSAAAPEVEGAARAMQGALLNADLSPTDVDVIFAHSSSTLAGDLAETQAIRAVFDRHAYRIPVTATKSMVGHTMGAAGAISTLAAACSMRNDLVPPTINYTKPDPDCDLDYVPNKARPYVYKTAMVNAFGVGGHYMALLLGRYDSQARRQANGS